MSEHEPTIKIEIGEEILQLYESGPSSPVAHNRPTKYNNISRDKKDILINLYRDGKTITEAAKIAGINANTSRGIINKLNKNGGEFIEKNRGGLRNRSIKLSSEILDEIERIVEINPSITLKKIREKILESKQVNLSIASIQNGLKRLRITLKCASMQSEHQNSLKTIEARKEYALRFSHNAPEDRRSIIFIDESGFNYHLLRTKAQSNLPKGRNVSLIAAINIEGILWHETIAHTAISSDIFCSFLEKLLQKLAENNLNEVWLVLDNASIRHTEIVNGLIEHTNHTLIFLPPYSQMMNPMEEVFSKIKFSARNLLADPSNFLNLVDVINESVATITTADCDKYYMNMYKKLPAAAAAAAKELL